MIAFENFHLSSADILALQQAHVFAFPTDTLPALCARVGDSGGIEKIFTLKRRDELKVVMLMLPSLDFVREYFDPTPTEWDLIQKNSSGKVSFILPLREGVILPSHLVKMHEGKEFVGFRIPSLPLVHEILAVTGVLAQTSLNISGEPPFAHSRNIPFLDDLDFVYPFENHPSVPSTVVRMHNGSVEVLRVGAAPFQY